MLSENFKKDDGVTSVVGEMLILALVLIVVALLATSAFNMLPGARDKVADVAMSQDENNIYFWHKGGDWIDGNELTATMSLDSERYILEMNYLRDWKETDKAVFDLGGCYSVTIPSSANGKYELRLTTLSSVIYSGEVTIE